MRAFFGNLGARERGKRIQKEVVGSFGRVLLNSPNYKGGLDILGGKREY